MKLLIRQALVSDGAAVADIYGRYVLGTAITFEEVPPTVIEMEGRIGETLKRFPFLVGEVDGRVIGYVYAGAHHVRASYRWAVNVAVYLSEAHHRRGIGTLLYRELFSLLEKQGFTKACAGITLPNSASVRLHESLGFTPVGVYHRVGYKFGGWRDVGWWERSLVEFGNGIPSEPTPWREMTGFAEVVRAIS